LLKEVDRLLRPNGYFVYSAPPAYRKDKDFPIVWEKLINITTAMCWKLIAKHVQTAIWIKPEDESCRQKNADMKLLNICDPDDTSSPSWKSPLRNCVQLNTDQSKKQKLPPRPDRLLFYSRNLERIGQSISIAYKRERTNYVYCLVLLACALQLGRIHNYDMLLCEA
jgi:hypothetical protein